MPSGGTVTLDLQSLFDPLCHPGLPAGCANPGGHLVHRADNSSYPYFSHCPHSSSDCGQCFTDKTCSCDVVTHCCKPNGHPIPPSPPGPPQPPPPPAPTIGPFGQGQACGSAGSGCAGTFKKDLNFERLFPVGLPHWQALAAANVTVFRGNTTRRNESGIADTAVIVSRAVPSSLTLTVGAVERFMATIVTTVAMPAGYDPVAAALSEYQAAAADGSGLLLAHTAAWGTVWGQGGIEVLPLKTAGEGERAGSGAGWTESGSRALDIQSHLRSSFYYLISSIRADWPHGAINPGGLASDNYDTVFFDMEFYMVTHPAKLCLFRPMRHLWLDPVTLGDRTAALFSPLPLVTTPCRILCQHHGHSDGLCVAGAGGALVLASARPSDDRVPFRRSGRRGEAGCGLRLQGCTVRQQNRTFPFFS